MIKPRTLSGFMELLPKEQLKFNNFYNVIKETYESFGFLPLDTPVLEASEILLAKAGGETEKQIYTIERGDSKLVMRFDLTVPLSKYVSMHYGELSFPFRRYQIAKVYRGERAQKGRFREFYQADIDIIGDNELSIYNDAEIPYIIYTIFKKLNIGDFVIKINNRKILNGYFEHLNLENEKSELFRIIDKLPKIGVDATITEFKKLNISDELISNIISFITIKENQIEVLKNLNIDNDTYKIGLNELEIVVDTSRKFGIDNLVIDLTISRGLDYYTGVVYETFLVNNPEIGSICSGGRYDNLAEYYTDKKLPGVGISIGLTRLFDQLNSLGLLKDINVNLSDILIIPMTEDYSYIINIYNKIREYNLRPQIFYEKRSIKSIINYAINLGIKNIMFIGEDEIRNNTVTLKKLEEHDQITDNIEKILRELK